MKLIILKFDVVFKSFAFRGPLLRNTNITFRITILPAAAGLGP